VVAGKSLRRRVNCLQQPRELLNDRGGKKHAGRSVRAATSDPRSS
jgi:hypothetical protein